LWSHGSTPTSQPFQIVIGSELESDWRPWGVVAVTVHVTVPLNRVGSWVLSGVKLFKDLARQSGLEVIGAAGQRSGFVVECRPI
jgi:hypothetical protein